MQAKKAFHALQSFCVINSLVAVWTLLSKAWRGQSCLTGWCGKRYASLLCSNGAILCSNTRSKGFPITDATSHVDGGCMGLEPQYGCTSLWKPRGAHFFWTVSAHIHSDSRRSSLTIADCRRRDCRVTM